MNGTAFAAVLSSAAVATVLSPLAAAPRALSRSPNDERVWTTRGVLLMSYSRTEQIHSAPTLLAADPRLCTKCALASRTIESVDGQTRCGSRPPHAACRYEQQDESCRPLSRAMRLPRAVLGCRPGLCARVGWVEALSTRDAAHGAREHVGTAPIWIAKARATAFGIWHISLWRDTRFAAKNHQRPKNFISEGPRDGSTHQQTHTTREEHIQTLSKRCRKCTLSS